MTVRIGSSKAFAVRFHGRGGQGVVTAAEMLSVAAFAEGRHAQAFPTFGSERMGAPVVAYCRIDDRPIRSHDPVLAPDAVLVQDPTLLRQVAFLDGLTASGYLLINSSRSIGELGIDELLERVDPHRCLTLPATELARRHLGKPLPNTALLGGLAALTGVVALAPLRKAIELRFPGSVGSDNADAAASAFACVEHELEHADA